MKDTTTYKLISKGKVFLIPSSFPSLSNININIFSELYLKFQYIIKSDVQEETIKSFIKYWVFHIIPNFNSINIVEYEKLSQEFDVMKNILQLIKKTKFIENQKLKARDKALKAKLQEKTKNYQSIINLLFHSKNEQFNYNLLNACLEDDIKTVSFLTGIQFYANKMTYFLNIKEKTAAAFQFDGYLFGDCSDFIIPRSIAYEGEEFIITDILKKAFFQYVYSVSFPDNSEVKTIHDSAFSCSTIGKIFIPASVTLLEYGWCWQTCDLTSIYISPDNKYYKYINNCFIVGKSDIKSDVYDDLVFARRDIRKATIPSYIKRILPYAFHYCQMLETIWFTDDSNLQEIKYGAFYECSIKSISIPPSVTKIDNMAFYKCKNLERIEISPNSNLCYLGSDLFYNTKIKAIYLPEKVYHLSISCFNYTPLLSDIIISPDNKNFLYFEDKIIMRKSNKDRDEFDSIFFAKRDLRNLVIPSFIQYIFPFAFEYSTNLTKVDFSIDSNLKVIYKYAFYCSSIEELILPPSVTKICQNAFDNCKKLRRVVFHENSQLKLIDKCAFQFSSIERITIPQCCTKILDYAFYHCYQLQKVNFHENSQLEIIESDTFEECSFKYITIPKHVKSIKSYAFHNCKNLKKVFFHENSELKSIEQDAFSFTSIRTIFIPKPVVEIGKKSFSKCKKLTKVYFHENSELKSINYGAFHDSSIESIFTPRKLTCLSQYAFLECKKFKRIDFETNSELQSVEDCVFEESMIESIIIPPNTSKFGKSVFNNCYTLKVIELTYNLAADLIQNNKLPYYCNIKLLCINK